MVSPSISDLFGDQRPPQRNEYVLAQGFSRDPVYCRRVLTDERMWPREFEQLATNPDGRVFVDRALLFAIAERVVTDLGDPWSTVQLHAAIVFWGAPPGQSTSRAARPLATAGAAPRLAEAIKVVRGEGPTSAYRALCRGQLLWVSGLGPSYFTKLMYFAGYNAKPHMSQPLIMDDNVIAGLSRVTGQRWGALPEDYLRYIDLAKDWAYELDTDPDVIERRLFEIGS